MSGFFRILISTLIICFFLPLAAYAHKPSDSYLNIAVERGELSGRWDIALRDLEVVIGLDQNHDGALSWGEVISKKSEIFDFALAHLSVSNSNERAALVPQELLLDKHSDGAYAVLSFSAVNIKSESLAVSYELLFDVDPSHRGIATITRDGRSFSTVFSPDDGTATFNSAAGESEPILQSIIPFIKSGVWHILIGYDHVLFLVTLLLPATLVWLGPKQGWQPAPDLRESLFDVIKVVTSFTIAHSITLALTVIGTIDFPSRVVESVIAFSVALAAVNNIYPIIAKSRWGIAFVFGLIHGCGFASVLVDAGLPAGNFLSALFGFNLGVELGQLAIVAAVLPALFLSRYSTAYRGVGLRTGSAMATVIALIWMVERLLDVAIF